MPIYWAFLTYMLLKPGTETQDYWFLFSGIDKIIHISIFVLLGFVLVAAFPKLSFRNFFYITMIYAVLTEILQEEMHWGRTMELWDLVADIVWLLLGYRLYRFLAKLWLQA